MPVANLVLSLKALDAKCKAKDLESWTLKGDIFRAWKLKAHLFKGFQALAELQVVGVSKCLEERGGSWQ